MQKAVFPDASPSDCWLPSRRRCIMQRHHRRRERAFKVSFLPRRPGDTSSCSQEEQKESGSGFEGWMHPGTLKACGKGKPDSTARAVCSRTPELVSFKVLLGFQDFKLETKARQVNFFPPLSVPARKKKEKKALAAFVFFVGPSSAESIKPAHQLGHADPRSPWIIKRGPSTRSSDGGQERGPSHLSTTSCICYSTAPSPLPFKKK